MYTSIYGVQGDPETPDLIIGRLLVQVVRLMHMELFRMLLMEPMNSFDPHTITELTSRCTCCVSTVAYTGAAADAHGAV